MDRKIRAVAAVEETVRGLFGAAEVQPGRTLWLRGKHVSERRNGQPEGPWRRMTVDDLNLLVGARAIDQPAADRQEIRLLL